MVFYPPPSATINKQQYKILNMKTFLNFFYLIYILFIPLPASSIELQNTLDFLTEKENKYLKNKKLIKMCIDPKWMPFESFDNGKYIGISADYFNIINKDLPIKVIQTSSWEETLTLAKKRECDILSLAMSTKERKEYLNFTEPYLKIPLVLATKSDAPFINDIGALVGKKLGIVKGYAFGEILRQKYPQLNIVDVENVEDGLEKVENRTLYGYIGTLISVGYTIQKNFTNVVKISSKLDGTWNLSVAVRNDDSTLLSIMQKSLNKINEEKKQKILNNWIPIHYTTDKDYELAFKIILLAILIILSLVYFYTKERKLKKKSEVQNVLLDTIINTVPNPMFYKDANGVYVNANIAFTHELLNLKREEIIGKTLYDLKGVVPKNLADIYIKQDAKLYKEKKDVTYEAKVMVKGGKIKDFRIQKNLFYSLKHELLGYVGMMYDITELKQKEKKLKYLASTDPMTKLYNRRYFIDIGDGIFKLAKRDKNTLSVIMLDIDDFKKVNDTYGHDIGDKVIIGIASILHHSSRESDLACRFGGEEFILLLPKTSEKGALIRGEKLRKNVEQLDIDANGKIIHVSISVGVSQLKEELHLEELVKRADEALYDAKNSGKNRVSIG